ncbi:uncharacterized protein MEPE_04346 [Melanopsichium pennsylvanicum]|uniref:Uncharacterized protein n=1 Tax=Melanopsichium pennsylvanicum TaxID=63383 RepID=A0AAJ5C6A8_9BASI|nr:uncharacterized protein MEPE_04346 [Melanopsichium pennsylvanicum]
MVNTHKHQSVEESLDSSSDAISTNACGTLPTNGIPTDTNAKLDTLISLIHTPVKCLPRPEAAQPANPTTMGPRNHKGPYGPYRHNLMVPTATLMGQQGQGRVRVRVTRASVLESKIPSNLS